MAILSRPFGGVTLSGEDAVAFRLQIIESRPNPLAIASCRRGMEMVRQIRETGSARITL
jgi:hypothetical protein